MSIVKSVIPSEGGGPTSTDSASSGSFSACPFCGVQVIGPCKATGDCSYRPAVILSAAAGQCCRYLARSFIGTSWQLTGVSLRLCRYITLCICQRLVSVLTRSNPSSVLQSGEPNTPGESSFPKSGSRDTSVRFGVPIGSSKATAFIPPSTRSGGTPTSLTLDTPWETE